ncbi:unnamed protein product [Rhizophagus irregularis]|uniref:Uncharacterized protein n=1 Tax=Rhizophagus irregularis TaxID=588596 RepID=A0A915ZG74_9GLOM|nr:unnamed protein product [Rhizophagus irregularis]
MNELWKPGRKTKKQPGFKRTNYDEAERPGFKKKNELWKPGRETKLNDQDSKKKTNYGQGPDPNQIRIRFKSDSNGSEPDSDQIEPDLIGFGSDQIY